MTVSQNKYIVPRKRIAPVTCSVDGCESAHKARGLCGKHYLDARSNGSISSHPVIPRPRAAKSCLECPARTSRPRRGLCGKCYETYISSVSDAKRCFAEKCPKAGHIKGMCRKHYTRMWRNGTTGISRAEKGTGHLTRSTYRGYVIIGYEYEHRQVMSAYLGRSLLKGENVHHRNGVKTENTVGPCAILTLCSCADGPHNLELWSKAQPAGQRVRDLVAYARKILELYGPRRPVQPDTN